MLRETRWVLLTLYNVVLNFAAVLPLLSLGGWDDDKQAMGLVVSLEFSAGGIILANLLPKVLSTWRHKKTSTSASKSSVHGKVSTEGSSHGLVKLDVSLRGVGPSGPGSATPVSQQLKHHTIGKKGVKKKLLADEVEVKLTKESPTLTGIDRRPLNFPDNIERAENGIDESQQEISVSSRADFRIGNNDSFILMDKPERPESPSNLQRFMDDMEMTGTPEAKRAPQPSEPTILEEEEQTKDNTPQRSYRNLKSALDPGSFSKSPSPMSNASGSTTPKHITPPGATHTLSQGSPKPETSGKNSGKQESSDHEKEQEQEQEQEQNEDMEVY